MVVTNKETDMAAKQPPKANTKTGAGSTPQVRKGSASSYGAKPGTLTNSNKEFPKSNTQGLPTKTDRSSRTVKPPYLQGERINTRKAK